jgi:hypothetical protein
MEIIHFTREDVQRIRDARKSDLTKIRIEEAPNCNGVDCGKRVPLSEEECGYQEPIGPHCHLVLTGDNPAAGPRLYAVMRLV